MYVCVCLWGKSVHAYQPRSSGLKVVERKPPLEQRPDLMLSFKTIVLVFGGECFKVSLKKKTLKFCTQVG